MPAFLAGLRPPGVAQQGQDGQTNAQNVPLPPFQNLPTGNTVPLFTPFSSMVPLPQIPIPPSNLTELSEEELRAMEGNLRQAVEARIQTLQRVQLLLDAANAMMSQYISVAPPVATTNNTNTTVPTSSTDGAADASGFV